MAGSARGKYCLVRRQKSQLMLVRGGFVSEEALKLEQTVVRIFDAPDDLPLTKPKMGTAFLLPPYGGKQRCRPVSVLRQPPAWSIIWQKIHMQYSLASTRAKHCSLFEKAVVTYDVERVGNELGRKRLIDQHRAIGSRLYTVAVASDKPDKPTPKCEQPLHSFGFSESSVSRSNGCISPFPT